jgi:S-adenosylmethionine hydrolase
MENKPIIALLTDFGTVDPYVGIMKGVILSIAPNCSFIDLTHHVRPQNILQASYLLKSSYPYFPKETIFVCVIDPGVGTRRPPVLVQSQGYTFIGPDNGLFGFLNDDPAKIIIQLENERYFRAPVSKTFHGRDIFAPVAAHLTSEGNKIFPDLGPKRSRLLDVEGRLPTREANMLEGKVVHIDHFGNLITNIHASHLENFSFDKDRDIVKFKDIPLPIMSTFSEAPESTACVLVGSSGHLEIFTRNGSAEKTLNAHIGDAIHVFKHHG